MSFKCPICQTSIDSNLLYEGIKCPYCNSTMEKGYIENYYSLARQEKEKEREKEREKELIKKYHAKILYQAFGDEYDHKYSLHLIIKPDNDFKSYLPGKPLGTYWPNGEYKVTLHVLNTYRGSTHNISTTIRITDSINEVTIYYKKTLLFGYVFDRIEYK